MFSLTILPSVRTNAGIYDVINLLDNEFDDTHRKTTNIFQLLFLMLTLHKCLFTQVVSFMRWDKKTVVWNKAKVTRISAALFSQVALENKQRSCSPIYTWIFNRSSRLQTATLIQSDKWIHIWLACQIFTESLFTCFMISNDRKYW